MKSAESNGRKIDFYFVTPIVTMLLLRSKIIVCRIRYEGLFAI